MVENIVANTPLDHENYQHLAYFVLCHWKSSGIQCLKNISVLFFIFFQHSKGIFQQSIGGSNNSHCFTVQYHLIFVLRLLKNCSTLAVKALQRILKAATIYKYIWRRSPWFEKSLYNGYYIEHDTTVKV